MKTWEYDTEYEHFDALCMDPEEAINIAKILFALRREGEYEKHWELLPEDWDGVYKRMVEKGYIDIPDTEKRMRAIFDNSEGIAIDERTWYACVCPPQGRKKFMSVQLNKYRGDHILIDLQEREIVGICIRGWNMDASHLVDLHEPYEVRLRSANRILDYVEELAEKMDLSADHWQPLVLHYVDIGSKTAFLDHRILRLQLEDLEKQQAKDAVSQ